MKRTSVGDIMTKPAIVIGPDTTLPIAGSLMKQHAIRHLPVVENGRLVGVVSRGDLREASTMAAVNSDSYELNFTLARMPVSRLMTRKVMTVTPEAPIVHAAELMTRHKIAGLPVVDTDGSVIGIVTGSDLLKLLVRSLGDATEESDEATSPTGSDRAA